MRTRNSFTLTELLVVVAIIAILAGLLIPAVMLGQQKGRETQAKADMNTIILALKGVENTYQQMVKAGDGYMPSASNGCVTLGKPASENDETDTGTIAEYNTFIVELTDPSNALFNTTELNINKRKIRFLEPKSDYDPTKSGTSTDNEKALWKDPWGNPYILIINTDFTDKIKLPESTKYIAGKAAIYSRGPNGIDEDGKNAAEGTGSGKNDDIVSWK